VATKLKKEVRFCLLLNLENPIYFPNLPYLFYQNYRTLLGWVQRGTKGFQDMAREISLKREIVTKRALNTSFKKHVLGAILMPQRSKLDFSWQKSQEKSNFDRWGINIAPKTFFLKLVFKAIFVTISLFRAIFLATTWNHLVPLLAPPQNVL
jgi:hypothetical protein